MTTSPSNGGPPPAGPLLNDESWDPAIRAGLTELIRARPGVATFDFDDTLLDGDLSLTLLHHLDPTGAAREHYEQACRIDVRAAYAELVETLIVGRTEHEVRALSIQALDNAIAAGSVRFRSSLRELVWALQRHGWTVLVVTASPAVVVAPAAARLGIPADHVLGMWCERGEDDRFLAPTREPITYRQGKVDAIALATKGGTPDFAVGDAVTDLEMLRAARYALVVDKGVAELRENAKQHGWWLQEGAI